MSRRTKTDRTERHADTVPLDERRASFEQALITHLDPLYGMAMRLTRRPDAAEDLVQNTIVKALRFWETFDPQRSSRTNAVPPNAPTTETTAWLAGQDPIPPDLPPSSLKAWLFKILTNTFYNTIRKEKNIGNFESDVVVDTYGGRFISSATLSAGTGTSAISRLSADEIGQSIDKLPPDFRHIILLCDVYGFSYAETSQIANCPIGTVMSRLSRARQRLRQSLVPDFETPGVGPTSAAAADSADADSTRPVHLDAFRKRNGTKS